MLLRMLPEQVSDQWEAIRPGIESTLPYKVSEHNMNMLLEEFMIGNMHCWVLEEDDNIYAIITTKFSVDIMDRKNMVVFSVFGYRPATVDMWVESYNSLSRWAVANGCVSMVGQFDNETAESIVNNFNVSSTMSIVSIDLHKKEEL